MGMRIPKSPSKMEMRFNLSSPLNMGVTCKYMGVGYENGKGKTPPHSHPIAMPDVTPYF